MIQAYLEPQEKFKDHLVKVEIELWTNFLMHPATEGGLLVVDE
jgi:helix-turn-helix protein